ncbi:hypothetical protein TBLA_0C06480 [Henningerozyma blattae CBS 6284]|uniref:Uncharacterized protein n=1 Tax=Henningerozyma blattae (strain ATCC 34711 / CBS 6284 / DSM 70876 / NBRC 10599 / NRRL Y-10934 / UCD 77-7) TaxID=1071380 RepID=I2H239_HENB6|nr:hypothetical protein TBLA_0C06480 [Tetrapisispora blattae CBS 6284]CCH60441.1 hypothetical protein TBLA_0C06480 [Tetrapisispora blattae CBS 6284]
MDIKSELIITEPRQNIYVFNIDNSKLLQDIDSLQSDQEKQENDVKANISELVFEVLTGLLINIESRLEMKYGRLPDTDNFVINLNLQELRFSYSVWDQFISLVTSELQFKHHVYITKHDNVMDRQIYLNTSSIFRNFRSHFNDNDKDGSFIEQEEETVDYEVPLKMILMDFMQTMQLSDEELSELLIRYHSLEELFNFVSEFKDDRPSGS